MATTNTDTSSAAQADHSPKNGDKTRAKAGPASNYSIGLAVMAGLDAGDAEESETEKQTRLKEERRSASGSDSQRQAGDDDQRGEGDDTGGAQGGEGDGAGGDDQGAEGQGRSGDDAGGDGDDQAGAGEGEGDDAQDTPEARQLAADTRKHLAIALKDFSTDQRKVVEGVIGSRIARLTKQHTGERDRLQTQIADITGELEESQRSKGPISIAGVHPALLVEAESDLSEIQRRHDDFLDWADDNREGFNLADSDKYDPSQPTYTAEEIRRRVRNERREHDRILPQARDNLKKRAENDAALRKAMPALFDAKTPEYRSAHLILKDQPWLRQYPDFRMRVARQILGEKALAGLLKPQEQQRQRQGGNQQQGNQQQQQQRKAPRLPGSSSGGGSGKGGSDGRRSGGSGAPEALKNFGKAPTQRNLASIVEKML